MELILPCWVIVLAVDNRIAEIKEELDYIRARSLNENLSPLQMHHDDLTAEYLEEELAELEK
jgi:hypothetical protein